MPSHKNNVIVAAAGGRKTTSLVESAIKQVNKKILITTYTLENLDQIRAYIIERRGIIPENIKVQSWFTFLLREGIRPYQAFILGDKKVKSVDFESTPPRYVDKGNSVYFLNKALNIYRDRVSDFVCLCNGKSDGLIIQRLEKIYDQIYIDEMQDLSGWDQNLIELLLKSSIEIILMGDPRQSTYATNNSLKNKGTKGRNMIDWILQLEDKNLCNVEERRECYRSIQEICDFADMLYPQLPKTISKTTQRTGHDGIFYINLEQVSTYIAKYNPKILRWNKKTATMNFPAINIGVSKGRTYERVLIFPTAPMKDYLKTKDTRKAGDISKFYVAITRAKFSVAFVVNN